MSDRLRVSAVSYLNTAPLVWGLTHGPQRGLFDLRFSLPSECADALRAGEADIGLVPTIELARASAQPTLGWCPPSSWPVSPTYWFSPAVPSPAEGPCAAFC